MVAGLLLSQLPLFDELRGQAVILSQARQGPVVPQVRPAVADIDGHQTPILDQPDRTDRRTHAFELGVFLGAVPDRSIGRSHGGDELIRGVSREGSLGQGSRHGRGGLSSGMTPHPVRDYQEPSTGNDGVLVAVSYEAHL